MAKSMLIVDDEATMRHLYKRIFSNAGYDFTLAGSVTEGRALLEGRNYDLIITDLVLEDGAGTELISIASGKTEGVSAILISGAIESWEVPLFTEKFKLKHCLRKPFALGTLLDAVKEILA